MTAENLRLSQPESHPAPPKPGYGGLLIRSAEGTRWAYAATPLPIPEGGQMIEEPQKVEGARMMAASIVSHEVELPLAPLPEPAPEPTEE
jgi:hypothetical protein